MSTLPDLLLGHARGRPEAPALREKKRGRWHEYSWSDYAQRVARVAGALRELGVEPGDRVVVEDAPAGTEAARRAGMRSVGVLSSHGQLKADIVVRTLEELPDTAFDDLLEGAETAR